MTLRKSLIRLAHEKPELRAHLLPILKDAAEEKEAARFALPRSSYMPKDNPTLKRVEDTPPAVEIWTWDEFSERLGKELYLGIAFVGKSEKPSWYHSFRSVSDRETKIQQTLTNYRAVDEMKRKRQEERRQFKHELAVGDILYSSWGYDQTNVDWFEVVAVPSPKTVMLREVEGRVVREGGSGADYVVAMPGKFKGPMIKKVPGLYGVKIDESRTAYKWDGKPKYQTASGWGH